jgi:hypothetical protein
LSFRQGQWAYFWNLPGWARAAGCPVANEPLGTDYEEARRRAETVLLPAFDAWRGGDATAEAEGPAKQGTLDWLFSEYRASRQYTKLPTRSRREGKAEQWAIEMGGPAGLARQGWKPNTLTPGIPAG